MWFIWLCGFALLLYLSVCVRIAVSNPFSVLFYGCKDFIRWLKFKKWRICHMGELIAFVGLFGKGKTLSAVHFVCSKFRHYNNKRIYDFNRRKWVTQKVHIISNVDLAVPYEKFVGLAQIVQASERFRQIDEENNTLTCVYVLGDEFSVQLNSRKFKENIDPLFLNTLLTCRHHHITLVYTSQRFAHVDALLRQVTSYVVSCDKCWRFMIHSKYDAFTLENATDPTLVKPMRRYGWFIRDRDFNAYDTLACVENLKKTCKDGDMLTEEEILQLQQNNGVNMDAVVNPSRRYVRIQKKMRK